MMIHALLLQPPPGNLTGPQADAAYLKASTQQNGYDVRVHDLGIEAFDYLRQPQRIGALLEKADVIRQQLESKGALRAFDKRWYGLLLMAKGFGIQPDMITDAISGLKVAERFHDYDRYKADCKVLDAFFRMLRAVHYPTMVTPSGYPTAHELKSMKSIQLHRDTAINPYMFYYENVLFPQIDAAPPSVIGIAMETARQSVQALVLGGLLKQRYPDIHVTLFGAYLTQWVLLMDAPLLSALFTMSDSVMCGDAESPFPELLDRCVNGGSLADVPNLIFRDDTVGNIRMFESLVFSDLTQLPPPDFSDLDLSAYLIPEPILPYALTRGCYWQRCGFCQNRIGKYRPRPYQSVPVDKAVAEVTTLSETYHAQHFHFIGNVIDPDTLKAFCDAKIASGSTFLWNTALRAEKAFTPDFCRHLHQAGLNSAAIGFESGCQLTLDRMDTGTDIPTISQTLRNLHGAGVATEATGILGFPGETEKHARWTIEFLRDHLDVISTFNMGLLLVRPGSAMHNDPEAFGVGLISYDHNPLLTPEPLWKAASRIHLGAVNRLFDALRQLENATCTGNDEPYVGAISSYHSFLYFKQGPDAIKRLRARESHEHQALHETFGMNHHHQPAGDVKPKIPRVRLPHTIYRSPYRHERSHFATSGPRDPRPLAAGPGWDFLLDPINVPREISPDEQQLLNRIDGQRDLASILGHAGPEATEKLRLFLIGLVSNGVVSLADNPDDSAPTEVTLFME